MTTDEFQALYLPPETAIWLILWALLGLFILWKVASGGPKGRWIALLFWFLWLYKTAFSMIGFINPDWLYSRHEAYHIGSLSNALHAGKTEVWLRETVNFPWTAVCALDGGEHERLREGGEWEGARRIVKEALGHDFFWKISWNTSSDSSDTWLVFATPDGNVVMEPGWWRLSSPDYRDDSLTPTFDFIRLEAKEGIKPHWRELCYLPEEAVLKFRQK